MGKGTAGKVAPLPALSPLCSFGPSELFLIFQVETGAREEEGVTSLQSFYEPCLWHVWSVASLWSFGDLQGQRSQYLSGSCPRAAPLSQGRALSVHAASFPWHHHGLLPLQSPCCPYGPCQVGFSPLHLVLQGEQCHSLSLFSPAPAIPVGLCWALQFLCLSPLLRI